MTYYYFFYSSGHVGYFLESFRDLESTPALPHPRPRHVHACLTLSCLSLELCQMPGFQRKQKCGFEGIYDLFAIRIIIEEEESSSDNGTDSSAAKKRRREVMDCWQAFAIVTSMYQPNPKRLRDWLSVPKSNGYESLHITVLGPEQRWVEVQIRT